MALGDKAFPKVLHTKIPVLPSVARAIGNVLEDAKLSFVNNIEFDGTKRTPDMQSVKDKGNNATFRDVVAALVKSDVMGKSILDAKRKFKRVAVAGAEEIVLKSVSSFRLMESIVGRFDCEATVPQFMGGPTTLPRADFLSVCFCCGRRTRSRRSSCSSARR